YEARTSGPLCARTDHNADAPAVSAADLTLPPPAEGSDQVAARVAASRARQKARYEPINAKANGRVIRTNADADGELLEQVAAPDAEGRRLLTDAAEKFRLTARGYHRVLRLARTLADLEAAAIVRRPRIPKGLSYRRVMLRG